jgi:hypothetical protein
VPELTGATIAELEAPFRADRAGRTRDAVSVTRDPPAPLGNPSARVGASTASDDTPISRSSSGSQLWRR